MSHICKSCGGPLNAFKKEELIKPGFCPYCVDLKGNLKSYKDVLENMINYIKSDHPEIAEENQTEEAEKMLEAESDIWGQEFTGEVVEESLKSKDLLNYVEILQTEFSEDINPQSNHGFTSWHIHKIKFKRTKLERILNILKQDLKPDFWWADVSFKDEIYIVFNNKIFSGLKSDEGFKLEVNTFAQNLNLTADQLPFRD